MNLWFSIDDICSSNSVVSDTTCCTQVSIYLSIYLTLLFILYVRDMHILLAHVHYCTLGYIWSRELTERALGEELSVTWPAAVSAEFIIFSDRCCASIAWATDDCGYGLSFYTSLLLVDLHICIYLSWWVSFFIIEDVCLDNFFND